MVEKCVWGGGVLFTVECQMTTAKREGSSKQKIIICKYSGKDWTRQEASLDAKYFCGIKKHCPVTAKGKKASTDFRVGKLDFLTG